MLWHTPRRVTLDGVELSDVDVVAIERHADRAVAEPGAAGPHAVFADVPAERTVVRIKRRPGHRETALLGLGREHDLAIRTGPGPSDAPGLSIAARIVLTEVRVDLARRGGPAQTITAIALSADGAADPIAIALDGAGDPGGIGPGPAGGAA